MRDRLIELLDNSECVADISTFEELADHLLANGVIVPPCKVGDTVYYVKENSNIISIIMCEVEALHYAIRSYARIRPCVQRWIGNQSVYYKVAFSSFGKTVFLSREDAEKALEERTDED